MPQLRLLPQVTVVDTQEAAAETLRFLMARGGPIAIDTETTGLDLMRDRIVCWSMAIENQRYFIPQKFLLFFDRLFQRPDVIWYLANAKYDLHMLANYGVRLAGTVYDIIVMDAMSDDTRAHGLKEQAKLAYGVRWGDFKDLFLDPAYVSTHLALEKHEFTRFKRMSIGERLLYVYDENPAIVENYASCDAYFTYMRAEDLQKELISIDLPTEIFEGFNTLWDYFTLIEAPFTKVLWRMERVGIPVDLDYVRKLDGPMRDGIRAREKEIADLLGKDFKPNSPDEVAEVLFSKKGFHLTPVSYTKTGAPSTSEKDLKALQGRVKDQKVHDILAAILGYRHLTKLHGTFVAKIATCIGPDERVHSRINQSGARTGRLSCSDPNLMQIPIRNDEFFIRGMFIAPKGMRLLDCDYPQIQPRLAAVFAQEEKMLEAIRNNFDLHSANAANMYRVHDPDAVYDAIQAAKNLKESTKDKNALSALHKKLLKYRDGAKTVGLGVLFGEGPRKMSHQLRIEYEAAQKLIEDFFTTYPNIKNLIEETHAFAHDTGFAYTFLGRIRRFHNINNDYNRGIMRAEERAAFNHLIQGSEVELMKLAMLQIDANKEWNEMGGQLCMTVHDELLAFAPVEYADPALDLMKQLMADPFNWGPIRHELPISIAPDGKHGKDWVEAH